MLVGYTGAMLRAPRSRTPVRAVAPCGMVYFVENIPRKLCLTFPVSENTFSPISAATGVGVSIFIPTRLDFG